MMQAPQAETGAAIRDLLNGCTTPVTGADGFVGSHLTEALLEYGADVHALVRPTSSSRVLRLNEAERGRLDSSEVEELRVGFAQLHTPGGWRPRHSWEDGLRHTIRWYAENRDRWNSAVDWR